LFLIYINDLEKVIQSSKIMLYADDAKIYFAVPKNTENDTLRADLHKVYAWSVQMQLAVALQKCSVLHMGSGNFGTEYQIGDTVLPSVLSIVDLGVTVSHNLKFSVYCEKLAAKGFRMVNVIYRTFVSRDRGFLIRMFKTYVRSKLEYATEVWSPYLLKDIELIERVQRLFTRRLPGLSELSYYERLQTLKLQSLEERRLICDLVMVYKIIHGLVDVPVDSFFKFSQYEKTLRGHSLKLSKQFSSTDVRKYYFANRVVDIWNNFLTEEIITAVNVKVFKHKLLNLDWVKFLRSKFVKGPI